MSDADLLRLSQWLSPAFPVGAFAYSHGLERAVEAGDVRDAATARDWIGDVLELGSGRADATLLCAALAGGDPDELSATARALASCRARQAETEALGRAFAATVSATIGRPLPPMPYPVVVGVAARDLSLPAASVAALYLQGFAANLVSVAVRIVPLGQTAGQKVLSDLAETILTTAAAAADNPDPAAIATCIPGADLAAIGQETMEVRLFLT